VPLPTLQHMEALQLEARGACRNILLRQPYSMSDEYSTASSSSSNYQIKP
jgi:hypothetical protein